MSKCFHNLDNPISVISQRFDLIQLPNNLLQRLLGDIQQWYQNNGAQWTIDRLKFIRQYAIHYSASSGKHIHYEDDQWMKRRSDGQLFGHWGRLVRYTLSDRIQEVFKLLMCYTIFAYDGEPTESQVNAFCDSIEAPFTGDIDKTLDLAVRLQDKSVKILRKYVSDRKLVTQDVPMPENFLRNSRLNNRTHKTTTLESLDDIFTCPDLLRLFREYKWPFQALSVKNPDLCKPVNIPPEFRGIMKVLPLRFGWVNWIWEPARKERIVTDFIKPLEFLTKPFGERLYDIVKHIPWDSTYFEEFGYKRIQYQLAQGKKAYCFDLSQATDRFPYILQQAVFDSLSCIGTNFKEQSRIFDAALNGRASTPTGRRTWWEVGQPMGAFPSFSAFSLTHGLILMLYLYENGIEYKDQFLVHGDDLVILDEQLAKYYEEFIAFSGVKCNMAKTVISDKLAEFNSRLIFADKIVRLPKWRPINAGNVTDYIGLWGTKLLDKTFIYKSSKNRERLKKILSIPGIMPNDVGINPEGKSLQARINDIPPAVLDKLYTRSAKESHFVTWRQFVLSRFRELPIINLQEQNTVGEYYTVTHFKGKPLEGNFVTKDGDDYVYKLKRFKFKAWFKPVRPQYDEDTLKLLDYPLSEEVGYNSVLQQLLVALDAADQLDKAISTDLIPFLHSQQPGMVENYVGYGNSLDLMHYHSIVNNIGYIVKQFNESLHIDRDLITLNYIAQLDRGSKRQYTPRVSSYLDPTMWESV